MVANQTDAIAPDAPRTDRSFGRRWNHSELFDKGFVAVPTTFLRYYAHLKPHRLTSGEALFVLHLMEFKWDGDAPFPGYATLAQRMGISIKMARRHARALQTKKYLRREIRTGRTNRFDLSPLFDALLEAMRVEQRFETRRKSARHFESEMLEWMGKMVEAFRTLSKKDRKALTDWESEHSNGSTVATSDWPGWEKLIGKRPDG